MGISPLEPQIFGYGFYRMIASRPLGRLKHDIAIQINRSRRIEQLFDVFWCTDVRILLLELSINRPLKLGVVIDSRLSSCSNIVQSPRERISLPHWRRLVRKE